MHRSVSYVGAVSFILQALRILAGSISPLVIFRGCDYKLANLYNTSWESRPASCVGVSSLTLRALRTMVGSVGPLASFGGCGHKPRNLYIILSTSVYKENTFIQRVRNYT